MNRNLAATILITALGGLAACGSDDNSSSVTAVRIDTSVGTAATSAPETTASSTSASATSVQTTVGSTTESTDDSDSTATASSDDTNSTDLNIQSRMDQARAALQQGDFSTMLQALELSGLASDIEDREITILAPTDTAFADLSAGTVTSLLANPDEVNKVLKRHIIDELLTFDELSKKTSVKMMSGDTLTVTNDNGVVKVDGATVTEADTKLSGQNGQEVAVFAIDRVLLAN